MKRLKTQQMKKPTSFSFYFSGILMIVFIVLLTSCRSKTTGEDTAIEKERFQPMVKEAIEQEVEEFISPLPSSFEITQMLNDIGISYILGLSNPVSNVDRYFTERSKALNLGIYGADLAYASTYHMKQEVMLYLEATKKLTDELQISSAFNETLVESIEKQLDDKEELIQIITDSFDETYDFLNRNGKASLSLLVVSGSWIEGLFLTTHVSANVYHNYEIVKIIHGQKEPLEKLINVLEEYQEEQIIREFIDDLTPLKEVYDSIEDTLTEEQVNAISSAVETLREKIVA
jgi:hypothetical protein